MYLADEDLTPGRGLCVLGGDFSIRLDAPEAQELGLSQSGKNRHGWSDPQENNFLVSAELGKGEGPATLLSQLPENGLRLLGEVIGQGETQAQSRQHLHLLNLLCSEN